MLNERAAVRLGGISGILFVVLVVPSFLSAPDSPIATSGPQDVIDYFTDRQDSILTLNGLLLIFAAFFFLWFLGGLHGGCTVPRPRGTASRRDRWQGGCCS